MVYANPGSEGAIVQFKPQYENYIGGQWVAPVDSTYFDNVSPVNGDPFCKIPRSTEADINLALDAVHLAKDAWGATPATPSGTPATPEMPPRGVFQQYQQTQHHKSSHNHP